MKLSTPDEEGIRAEATTDLNRWPYYMEEKRNLITRIATAVVAVPILLLIFYLGGVYYLAFICLLAGLCSLEFLALAGPGIRKSRKIYITAISLLLIVSAFFDFVLMSFFLTFLIFSFNNTRIPQKRVQRLLGRPWHDSFAPYIFRLDAGPRCAVKKYLGQPKSGELRFP